MRLHRFFVPSDVAELTHDFWLRDEAIYKQWSKVLRYRDGDQVVLFDGVMSERLYKIVQFGDDAVHLEMITEFERKLPSRHVYLFFSLLKKDKNDWVIQKATELGVGNLVPIVASRSEKTGFNLERAYKIATEAAEQCGRSNIPDIREPISLETAIDDYNQTVDLYLCNEGGDLLAGLDEERPIGVFVGPEGGWTDTEVTLFTDAGVGSLGLSDFTLRAETACVTAVAKAMGL